MGVDYSSNAGIGMELPEDQVKELCSKGGYGGDVGEYIDELFQGTDFSFFSFGSMYNGSGVGWVATIKRDSLFKNWDTIKGDIEELHKFLTSKGFKDLEDPDFQHGLMIS